MRRNVFLRSMRRSWLRSGMLFVLIGLAAFGFVLRAVEFMVVREQIMDAALFYRTSGHIRHPMRFGDVSEGIFAIEHSPYLDLQDGRRAAQGFLQGMQNADVSGITHLAVQNIPARYGLPTITESYFYGYLLRMTRMEQGRIRLLVRVDEIITGHPEHIIPGQTLSLDFLPAQLGAVPGALLDMEIGARYFLRGAYLRPFQMRGERTAPLPNAPMVLVQDPISGELVEQRVPGAIWPAQGRMSDILHMWPLYAESGLASQIWFLEAPEGRADLSAERLAHIPGEIAMLERNQRNILLQSTKDMAMIPQIRDSVELVRGRMVNYSDYRAANPVATIDENLARLRNLDLGDFITVDIPLHQSYNQMAVGIPGFSVPLIRVDRNYPERFYEYEQITLEIVGITQFNAINATSIQSLFVFIPDSVMPADLRIEWIPMILYNRQWVAQEPVEMGVDFVPDAWYSFTLGNPDYYEHIMGWHWEQFVLFDLDLLIDHIDPSNFWLSANPILLAVSFNAGLFGLVLLMVLGLCSFLFLRGRARDIAIMRAIGQPAWRVLARLLISVIIISAPAIAIGGVAAWNFALGEAQATLAEFGDIYEDTFEISEAERQWALVFGDRPLPDFWDAGREIELYATLDQMWLWIFLGTTFGIILLMILAGGIRILRNPILALLQGNSTRKIKQTTPKIILGANIRPHPTLHNTINRAINEQERFYDKNRIDHNALYKIPPPPPPKINIPTTKPTKTPGDIFVNRLAFLRRHILRAPIKSALGAGVALFFLIALGWLANSIDTTYNEIHRVYDTTIVHAQIFANPDATRIRHVDDAIRPVIYRNLLDSPFIYDYYSESVILRTFVIAPDENGGMPARWGQMIRFQPTGLVLLSNSIELANIRGNYMHTNMARRNRDVLDFTIGVTDLEYFVNRHAPTGANRTLIEFEQLGHTGNIIRQAERLIRNFEIDFAPGFDYDRFNNAAPDDEIVPIIISYATSWRRGLYPGDTAIFAWTEPRDMFQQWEYMTVFVAGVHNEQIHTTNAQFATLVPYWLLPQIHPGGSIGRTYMSLAIDPTHNRDLVYVRESLLGIVNPLGLLESVFAPPPVTMYFHDAQLRNTIGALSQILTLLELLYPVAIVLAVIIGAGLAMLLALQNTKNAAVMRVLGASKKRTLFMLWLEQLLICAIGLMLGIIAMSLLGLTAAQISILAALYLIGAVAGAAIGAFIVTNKAPLDLLQTRE